MVETVDAFADFGNSNFEAPADSNSNPLGEAPVQMPTSQFAFPPQSTGE